MFGMEFMGYVVVLVDGGLVLLCMLEGIGGFEL